MPQNIIDSTVQHLEKLRVSKIIFISVVLGSNALLACNVVVPKIITVCKPVADTIMSDHGFPDASRLRKGSLEWMNE